MSDQSSIMFDCFSLTHKFAMKWSRDNQWKQGEEREEREVKEVYVLLDFLLHLLVKTCLYKHIFDRTQMTCTIINVHLFIHPPPKSNSLPSGDLVYLKTVLFHQSLQVQGTKLILARSFWLDTVERTLLKKIN